MMNYGETSGYYGDYNVIMQALHEMSDIEVVNVKVRHEIILREIMVTLRKDKKINIQLYIAGNDPLRKTRGVKLSEELNRRIYEKISNQPSASNALSRIKSAFGTWLHKLTSDEVIERGSFGEVHLHGYSHNHDGKSHQKYVY